MRRSLLAFLAISSLLLVATGSQASTRPRYGGTVRVLLRHKITSLDPLRESDDAATRDRIAGLIFETLTEIDSQGRARPRLASSWQTDSTGRVWQFNLRPATFQDGGAVSATAAAASLGAASPEWKVTAISKESLTIELSSPVPHLPELLALPRFSITKRLANDTLVGSGPYKLGEWQPGERALLTANDDYWGGRSFPDSIEFRMGVSLREHLMERSPGPDHAVELNVDQLRGLEPAQSNQTLLVSRPTDLVVLIFLQSGADTAVKPVRKPVDPRVREAMAYAINRAAINNVLLQRKGAPAGGLLPQWMTGYEFLFSANQDADRARKLRADAGAFPPLALVFDLSDPVMKAVAERVSVDAREAGILVQTSGDARVNSKSGRAALNADAVLLRVPLSSLDPTAAFAAMGDDLALPADLVSAIVRSARPEDLAEVERKALADYRLVPVVHLSHAVWINGNVHNWQQLPNGEWDLDRLWVEGTK
ncbi:MAG TPA: ABC transporter substrate-binding protein [Verrucomicrobiae bacterium]|jgi:ABC-type transport system substrate-binding protein|nr:ABC transporter substrate-binding protein [Verrucomicrobiae bacterium]